MSELREMGITRKIDQAGRVGIPPEFRRDMGLEIGDMASVTMLVDDENRMVGVLVRPTEWAVSPKSAPIVPKMRGRRIR